MHGRDYFLIISCASTYNSCSNCGGQCTTTCLFGSCKERSAGYPSIGGDCAGYACYSGGCGRGSYTDPSCEGFCSNSSNSMYTTCAGLATVYFIKNSTPEFGSTTNIFYSPEFTGDSLAAAAIVIVFVPGLYPSAVAVIVTSPSETP